MEAKQGHGLRRISGEFLLNSRMPEGSPDTTSAVEEPIVAKVLASSNVKAIRVDEKQDRPPARELRYHRGGLWLILIYSIVLILTWVMACVL